MSRPRLSALPPPPKEEKPSGQLGAAPKRSDAPQNMATADVKRWVDLSFKVTQEEKDEFLLEAAKRRMKHKELFFASWSHYRDDYPVPER